MGVLRRLPIRVRLTVAFAVAMIVVLAAAALFVYFSQREDLTDTIDSSLRSRSNDVAVLVGGPDGDLEELRGNRLASSQESFVQVLTPAGRRLDRTGETKEPALPPDDLRRAARDPITVERHVAGIDGKARMLARPVVERDRTLVVVAGASLADRDDTLSALLRSFLIGGLAAVLLASGVGYALATAGFAPIEAMRRCAKMISLGQGGERLPLPAAHDEVRRLGETLNEMLARLEASFERERRFVADASHELRTPLAVLKTELEAALRSTGEGPTRESLAAALEETDHLAQLAEDLLLIARAADGGLPIRRERVEVREFLERNRDRFADRAREQGRRIDVDAPGSLRVEIDPLRGRQAIGNLIDNALRHGAGDIRLRARDEGGTIEIDVADQGPGFPHDLAPHAFERFARAGGARSGDGAGLGLAIVQVIAKAHDGSALIVNGSANGTTVRLRIPT